jgi:hypothetical protein
MRRCCRGGVSEEDYAAGRVVEWEVLWLVSGATGVVEGLWDIRERCVKIEVKEEEYHFH